MAGHLWPVTSEETSSKVRYASDIPAWASFIPFDRHVLSAVRSLRQAQGEREWGMKRRRSIEKLIFNRARLSSLECLVQYLNPVLDRQRGATAYMHEATYIGGGDPIRMTRFERRYLVFQQLLR